MGDGFGTGSHWVRIGSNTNSTLDSSALIADNSNTIINSGLENPAPGTAGEMRRECHVWMDENGDTGGNASQTANFDWVVKGDFTVTINAALKTLDADPGNVDVDVYGSVDGTNYTKMADLITWTAGTATMAVAVYDYDGSGVMPYMRLEFSQTNDVDNSGTPIKVVVNPH